MISTVLLGFVWMQSGFISQDSAHFREKQLKLFQSHQQRILKAKMAKTSLPQQEMQHVLSLAIISRILVLGLIIICRCIASPYDTSGSLNPPCLSISSTMDHHEKGQEQTGLSLKLGNAIEATVVWDSVYYVRIAQCGYEYEQTYAFLPLLPLSMQFLFKTVLAPLVPVFGQRAVLALSGYTLSNIAFVLAAFFLYKLTLLIFKDSKAALRTTALFCFNPASIFYSSIYSESLFSLLSFAGIYYLLSGSNWKATLLFALSSAVRSNGVINAGFFLFQAMHQGYEAFFQKNLVLLTLQVLFVACLQSLCVFLPFLIFQLYGFLNICHGGPSSQGSRPWCTENLPYVYGFVQSHYWDVGFLRYFQLKQLPNFLLASPMLLLGTCSVLEYSIQNYRLLFSLGFQASYAEKETAAIFYSVQSKKTSNKIAVQREELANPVSTFSSASESCNTLLICESSNILVCFVLVEILANGFQSWLHYMDGIFELFVCWQSAFLKLLSFHMNREKSFLVSHVPCIQYYYMLLLSEKVSNAHSHLFPFQAGSLKLDTTQFCPISLLLK